MANSEIYGKQRTCLYITQGESRNLRENMQNVLNQLKVKTQNAAVYRHR